MDKIEQAIKLDLLSQFKKNFTRLHWAKKIVSKDIILSAKMIFRMPIKGRSSEKETVKKNTISYPVIVKKSLLKMERIRYSLTIGPYFYNELSNQACEEIFMQIWSFNLKSARKKKRLLRQAREENKQKIREERELCGKELILWFQKKFAYLQWEQKLENDRITLESTKDKHTVTLRRNVINKSYKKYSFSIDSYSYKDTDEFFDVMYQKILKKNPEFVKHQEFFYNQTRKNMLSTTSMVKKQSVIEKQDSERKEAKNQIGIKDFVVRRSILRCKNANHAIEDIKAELWILDREGEERLITVSAGYCPKCNIYFIMEPVYQQLKNRGTLLCKVSDEKTYLKSMQQGNLQLAQQSILNMYGYSVSQQEGLTEARRRKILAILMDSGILSASEIISYLNFFISYRGDQEKFEIAIAKWQADIEFVANYRVGGYKKFGVREIYRK